jgi:hypothetical protein
MRMRALVALAGTLLLGATVAAQDLKLLPVDEGATDPQWPRFKARLLEALARRDQQFVLDLVEPDIRNTSGTAGVAEFKKLWELQSASSALWTELPKLLFIGSVYVKRDAKTRELCAPYVYYRWPESVDGNVGGAIIARQTLLKAQPAAGAATVTDLSYDVVTVADWEVDDQNKDSAQKWVKVKAGAREGYVPEEHVRSPLEYRACFSNRGARWRMTALEVGE